MGFELMKYMIMFRACIAREEFFYYRGNNILKQDLEFL
ncbi:hypothetical protein BHO_0012300 (plasmid) [Borrelia hermsii YBT]|uniref:Uncharacterized protein n=1 Tax=Borrelia hermsii YBT TaxID=1313295 RepID=W5T2L9_BORHE|nr:hypothetical protein BHO_0012300 [Borrelia hermsii YBT]